MIKYLLKRGITYVAMTFIATTAAYFLAVWQLRPGLTFETKVPRPSPESIARSLRSLGLDQDMNPVERYFNWLGAIITRWDWGRSPNGAYVNTEFSQRVWISFWLIILSVILTLIIGVALGVYTASRQYKLSDRVITGYSYLTFILPAPVAYLLVQLLFIKINQLIGNNVFFVTDIQDPTVSGFWPSLIDIAMHYIVPTFALTIFGWASYQVSQRQFLLDNVATDFVRTARATGLTRDQAIRRHALRVSFIPTAQSIAFQIPALFVGSFFAEQVFNWPGLGVWSIKALGDQDVNVAVAMVAYGAVVFAIGAMLADIATAIIDPRVRVS